MKSKITITILFLILLIIPFSGCLDDGETTTVQNKSVNSTNYDLITPANMTVEEIKNNEFHPYVRDLRITVNETNKKITFIAVLNDSTSPDVALDFADTFIRRYHAYASMENRDNDWNASSKNYYGGLYDTYTIDIAIAPVSKASDRDYWWVDQIIYPGTHRELKLTKMYN